MAISVSNLTYRDRFAYLSGPLFLHMGARCLTLREGFNSYKSGAGVDGLVSGINRCKLQGVANRVGEISAAKAYFSGDCP